MLETLLFTLKNHIATITFNRPKHMNSFNDVMANELEKITKQVRSDDTIRVVLLNGADKLFMAGGDIHFFNKQLDTMPAGVLDIIRTLNASIMHLMHMPKPVLASVHGSVAGVGMSLMMACDLVIAANNTKFTMAYSGIGITPDGGATFNLPRLVGPKKAMEWILLSDVIDTQQALIHGLINWAVPAESLTDETQRLLTRLAKGPALSYARAKALINQSWQTPLETQLEKEGDAFEYCSATEDFKQGVTCFLNKTQPTFKDKLREG